MALAAASTLSGTAAGFDRGQLAAPLAGAYPALRAFYEDLHAHPELSFCETNTAGKLAAALGRLGLEVTERVGQLGVVGVLRNGVGSTVLVRADLDALPIREETGLPCASHVRVKNREGQEVGVMHPCGHDLHMTVLLGTATLLTRLKEHWRGSIVFIGQPAEETGGGARAMLADGLFSRFPRPDHGLALHVSAELAAGTVGVTEGPCGANVDSAHITVRGVGGHGAHPHKARDPVVLAAQIVLALQTIISRERDPLEPAVVTVGSIHGGTKSNIIPDEVHLELTVRTLTDDSRTQVLEAIRRIVRGQALAAGLPEDRLPIVSTSGSSLPAVHNDPALTRRLAGVWRATLGETNGVIRKPSMGGEDFSLYGRAEPQVPLCLFALGTVDPARLAESQRSGQPLPPLHSARYHPLLEPSLKTGVTAMTAAVLDLLAR